jgi:hypothetical protein
MKDFEYKEPTAQELKLYQDKVAEREALVNSIVSQFKGYPLQDAKSIMKEVINSIEYHSVINL